MSDKSPLASDVMSATDAADSGFMVASIVKELYDMEKLPVIELHTDSKSLKEHLGTKKVIQDSRLWVDTARLREMVEIGEVHVTWVPTELMLADCLTKKDASSYLLRQVLASGKLPEDLEDNNEAKDVNSVNSVKKKNKGFKQRKLWKKKEVGKVTNNEEKILNITIMNW